MNLTPIQPSFIYQGIDPELNPFSIKIAHSDPSIHLHLSGKSSLISTILALKASKSGSSFVVDGNGRVYRGTPFPLESPVTICIVARTYEDVTSHQHSALDELLKFINDASIH